MGVYIPNMEKPKECSRCPCESDTACQVLDSELGGTPLEGIRPDCLLIEIDETDTELLEFFNEFKKWENCKEVAKYIKTVYGERRTDETNSRLLDDM